MEVSWYLCHGAKITDQGRFCILQKRNDKNKTRYRTNPAKRMIMNDELWFGGLLEGFRLILVNYIIGYDRIGYE